MQTLLRTKLDIESLLLNNYEVLTCTLKKINLFSISDCRHNTVFYLLRYLGYFTVIHIFKIIILFYIDANYY